MSTVTAAAYHRWKGPAPALPPWLGAGVGNTYFDVAGALHVVTPDIARRVLTAAAAGLQTFAAPIPWYDVREAAPYGLRMVYPTGWIIDDRAEVEHGLEMEWIPFPTPIALNEYEFDSETYVPRSGFVGFHFDAPASVVYRNRGWATIGWRTVGGTPEFSIGDYECGRTQFNPYIRYLEYGCFLRQSTGADRFEPESA